MRRAVSNETAQSISYLISSLSATHRGRFTPYQKSAVGWETGGCDGDNEQIINHGKFFFTKQQSLVELAPSPELFLLLFLKCFLEQVPGEALEPRWNRSPVATTLKETEEQLLLVSRENQVLKIKVRFGLGLEGFGQIPVPCSLVT